MVVDFSRIQLVVGMLRKRTEGAIFAYLLSVKNPFYTTALIIAIGISSSMYLAFQFLHELIFHYDASLVHVMECYSAYSS